MQTEVKIDIRYPPVNGTMAQFFQIAIIFATLIVFMLVFVAQQLAYSQICSRNSSTIYQGYSSAFQVGCSSPKLEGNFCKWEGIFTINIWRNAHPLDFNLFIFEKMIPLRISLIYTNTICGVLRNLMPFLQQEC